MPRLTILRTVVFRLVAALVVGGLAISAGLSVLELHNAETLLRINVSQNVALTVRNIQSVLYDQLNGRPREEVREIITAMTTDRQIRAARLSGEGFKPLEMGDWNVRGLQGRPPLAVPRAQHRPRRRGRHAPPHARLGALPPPGPRHAAGAVG